MKKILVTGATGFLGGWTLRRLCEEYGKENCTGTGRNALQAEKLRKAGYILLLGDLSDEGFVKQQLQGFTQIVHCAARSSLWGKYNEFYRDNVQSTINLLDNIPSLKSLIYISTPGIYFNFSDRFNVSEDSPLPKKFVNHYTKTKYLAEQILQNPVYKHIRHAIIRPRAIIGAGDTVIMPRVIRAHKSKRLKIIGDGKNICDFSSVNNVVEAIYLCTNISDKLKGEIFNITDGNPVELWPTVMSTLKKLGYESDLKKVNYKIIFLLAALIEWISNIFNKKEPVLTKYGVGLLKYSLTMDISRAEKLLNYKPIISTEESINEFVEEYLKNA